MLKLLVAFSLLTCNFGSGHVRINKGTDVEENEYPFVVVLFITSIRREHGFYRKCTASMLTRDCALTAAHCVTNKKKRFYIWYGNYTVSPLLSNMYTPIIEKIRYPGFRYEFDKKKRVLRIEHDITLLRVERSITLERYGRVSSLEYWNVMGSPVKFVGCGRTDKNGDDQLRPLQAGAEVTSQCSLKTRQLTNFVLCVSPPNNASASTAGGDSGGPLLHEDKIVGLLSFGDDKEDAYVPISPYITWISSKFRLNTKKKVKCS